jgi:hypothetical protein
MSNFTKSELEEAHRTLTSTLQKCVKIQEGKKLGKSQEILLDRRVNALRLALVLIERETENHANE